MSRSRRKKPYMGNTTAASEKVGKGIWHRRWRAKERTRLGSLTPERQESHLPLTEREVSNVSALEKDGRQYWDAPDRLEKAKDEAARRTRNPVEYEKMVQRLLRKWQAK